MKKLFCAGNVTGSRFILQTHCFKSLCGFKSRISFLRLLFTLAPSEYARFLCSCLGKANIVDFGDSLADVIKMSIGFIVTLISVVNERDSILADLIVSKRLGTS